MSTKFLFAKTAFRNVDLLLLLFFMANALVSAQVNSKNTPVFEIIKVQDGTESGDEIIYLVKSSDGAGGSLINTTNEDFVLAIEFGVDSDAESSDIMTEFPIAIAIEQGTESTLIKLAVYKDHIEEATENLVAMIYNPSVGKISDTLFYATATISDSDAVTTREIPMPSNEIKN